MRRTASVLLLLLALTTSAWAQQTWYVAKTGDDGNAGSAAAPFLTIAKAISMASTSAIDEIIVGPGTYQENLTINKNLKLFSSAGLSQTTIEGSQSSTLLGTVVVSTGSNGVVIGDVNQGFKIIGIDGPPGLEKSAIYLQGTHTNMIVRGNELVANGDEAFMSEYNAAVTYITIDANIISGQTYTGSNPAGDGFGAQQWTLANVPRQLVVMGGGDGGTNTQHITFINNTITGTAGGYNTSNQEQGNTLVTIDAEYSTITGNTFAGTTTRGAASLRCRRPNTTISSNTFTSTNLTPSCVHFTLMNATVSQTLINANTFDKGVYVIGGSVVGLSIQAAIDVVPAGTVINVTPGTYNEGLVIGKSITLLGPNVLISPNTGARAAEAILRPTGGSAAPDAITGTSSNITVVIKGFTVDMIDTRYTATYNESKKFMKQTGKSGTTWTFEHNIFKNADYVSSGHWLVNGSNPGLVFNLLDNRFTDNGVSNGLSIWNSSPSTVTIQDNVWQNNGYTAMNLNNIHGSISNNIFRDTRVIDTLDASYYFGDYQSGILLANPDNALEISGNQFHNIVNGIILYQNVGGIVRILENTFDGTITHSIKLSSAQAPVPDPTDQLVGVTVLGNKFLNQLGLAIANSRTDTETLDARNNYWGETDNSGPYHSITNSSASGAEVADYILYDPWTLSRNVNSLVTIYDFDADFDGNADVAMTFNSLPAGGGHVYINRHSTIPSNWPAPPTNALTNTYVILTTDMPNYQFDVNVVLTYLGSGFGANTQAAYYNEDTEEWVIIGGTFTDNGVAGPSNDDTYAFRTNHFTPFVFINTPSTPLPLMLTDMMVSDAYDESTIPSTPTLTEPWQQWMGGGNLTDDWSWEYQNSTVSVIPMTDGADIFAATVTLRYNPADWQLLSPTGYTNGTKVGSLFTTPNYSTFFYQLPGTVSTDNTILADVSVQEAGNPMGTADGLNSLMDFAFKPIAANPSPITFLSAQVRDNLNQDYYLDLSDDSKGRIYLGDFVASSTVHNMGDGLIDIDDLTVWSISYFSDVSGVTYPGSLGNYKLKYDVGPTSTNYIDGMPEPDGKIEFEDLVIFAISYGLSSNGSYPKAMASQQLDLTLVSSAFDAGEYVDVPVRISGATDLRALSMTFTYDVNALTFDGAVHGSLVGENTPMFVQDRDGSVRIDVASFNEQGISGSDDLVVLRFRATRAGKDAVRLENALARDSRNTAISLRGASTLPETMTLEQNYPNPFNPSTNIRFSLPEKGGVELAVFDMLGRKVRTLVDATMSEGSFTVSFDGLDDAGASLPSGVYIYRLVVGERVAQRSMMLSK